MLQTPQFPRRYVPLSSSASALKASPMFPCPLATLSLMGLASCPCHQRSPNAQCDFAELACNHQKLPDHPSNSEFWIALPSTSPRNFTSAVSPLYDIEISALPIHCSLPASSRDLISTTNLAETFRPMINAELSRLQAQALRELLLSYFDIFDYQNHPLGQTHALPKQHKHVGLSMSCPSPAE